MQGGRSVRLALLEGFSRAIRTLFSRLHSKPSCISGIEEPFLHLDLSLTKPLWLLTKENRSQTTSPIDEDGSRFLRLKPSRGGWGPSEYNFRPIPAIKR
jgi:hypothetical protein